MSSANLLVEQSRSLVQQGQVAEALSLLKQAEQAGGNELEIAFERGVCFAFLGRTTEARAIVRRFKEEGHVALAHRLAERIAEEQIDDVKPLRTRQPPPRGPSHARRLLGAYAALAVLFVTALFGGILIGSAFVGGNTTSPMPEPTRDTQRASAPTAPAATPSEWGAPGSLDLTGNWQPVDFVPQIESFVPGQKQFSGDIHLEWVTYYEDGASSMPMTWADGTMIYLPQNIRVQYVTRQFSADRFLFLPWIPAGEVRLSEHPQYYVFKFIPGPVNPRKSGTSAEPARATAPAAAVSRQQGSLDLTGTWRTVDFVAAPESFVPNQRAFDGEFVLKTLSFGVDGSTTTDVIWGNGWITDTATQTRSRYDVQLINGRAYLFYPWLSGDVTQRGRAPNYYVLEPS